MMKPLHTIPTTATGACLKFLLAACCAAATALGSDFRDAPALAQTNLTGALDLGDLYVFRSPVSAENTVLIMTLSEFANVISPITFDPEATYDFIIDQDGDLQGDVTIRTVFGVPTREGFTQRARVQLLKRGQPARLLTGNAPTNDVTLFQAGGAFSAGLFDDPSFFDMGGFLKAARGEGAFPRESGARNYFGPNANCLAIVVEVPTVRLVAQDDRPVIRVWARVSKKGRQVDRVGEPFTSLFMIPALPIAGNLRKDRHDDFNAGRPDRDSKHYRAQAIDVLENFWDISRDRAGALVDDLFLPDVLKFDTSLEYSRLSEFPNGRNLRDDVGDAVLRLITGNGEATDGVGDDNGDKITDGRAGEVKKFPYLAPAHEEPAGPPVEPGEEE